MLTVVSPRLFSVALSTVGLRDAQFLPYGGSDPIRKDHLALMDAGILIRLHEPVTLGVTPRRTHWWGRTAMGLLPLIARRSARWLRSPVDPLCSR